MLQNSVLNTLNMPAHALQPSVVREKTKTLSLLKKGVWLYFILLIFEGALRKWFLPFLASPLLIIRDPLALWILLVANWNGFLPRTVYLTSMVVVGITGFFLALFVGHGNIAVALFGARILVLHFPLMFAIGKIFDRDDVIKLGKVTLWISLPITVLVALQFYSPQSAWVNRGVGGDMAGAGFSGALGYFRPSGTFSFTTGTTLFYGFLSCFVIYFWIQPKMISKLLLLTATGCLIAAIPLSISRSLFFQTGVGVLFALIAVLKNPKYLGRVIIAVMGTLILMAVLSKASFFQTSIEAFTNRFDNANEAEGGLKGVLGDRYLGGMIGALSESGQQPFFGYGIGMGTNVGSNLLSGGAAFLIAEGEWGRLIGEMGPLLGIVVIFIRIGFSFKIAKASFRKLSLNDFLPWMLLSFGLLTVPQAQWAQPTSLGFSTMIGGLMVAALHIKAGTVISEKKN